jgi:superfamily I DNA and RNA helicase
VGLSDRTKDRVFTIFKEWLVMVENQRDWKLKSLRSDNGGEYKSDEFVQFCWERCHYKGIGCLPRNFATSLPRCGKLAAKFFFLRGTICREFTATFCREFATS